MRKLALITAAAMMSIGTIGSAAATVNTPFAAPASSTVGVTNNGLALGLAQSGQDDRSVASTSGFGGTSIIVTVAVVIAIGLGIYVAVKHKRSRPTSP